MAQITLKNPQVAAKYTTEWNVDPIVHVCGIWKGKLSEIPLAAAEALVKQESNLLIPKETAIVAAPTPKVKETPKAE